MKSDSNKMTPPKLRAYLDGSYTVLKRLNGKGEVGVYIVRRSDVMDSAISYLNLQGDQIAEFHIFTDDTSKLKNQKIIDELQAKYPIELPYFSETIVDGEEVLVLWRDKFFFTSDALSKSGIHPRAGVRRRANGPFFHPKTEMLERGFLARDAEVAGVRVKAGAELIFFQTGQVKSVRPLGYEQTALGKNLKADDSVFFDKNGILKRVEKKK